MVGAGVLGLPYTFVYLGWAGGMLVMLLSLLISWYTFYGEWIRLQLQRCL
jgi:amino acid permease